MSVKIGDIVQYDDPTKGVETFVVEGIVSQSTPVDMARLRDYVGPTKVLAPESSVKKLHGNKSVADIMGVRADLDNVVWGV